MSNIKTGSIERVDFPIIFKHLLKQMNQSKRLIAGLFGMLLMLAAVSRIHAQSIIDTTFDPNVNGGVNAIAVQTDGKILIGGSFTFIGSGFAGQTRNRIARLNGDGSVDSTFNPNLNNSVKEIAVLPNGKILIAGIFTTVGGQSRGYLARLNADGSLDSAFNANITGIDVHALAVQTDGKILIGGALANVGGQSRGNIVRLNADGTPDTNFVNANATNQVYEIAVQSDGKILIGGAFTSVGGQTRNRIARLNTNGTLDTAFNPNVGITDDLVLAIFVQTDGKILIGGDFNFVGGQTRNMVARLNTNGTLDTAFNPNVNAYVSTITVQTDGKILIGGAFTSVGGQTRNRVARLNDNGTLDTAFNPNANGNVQAIAVQANGKILIGGGSPGFGGGFTTVDGQTRNGIARLYANIPGTFCARQPAGMVSWFKGEDEVNFILDSTGNQYGFRPQLTFFNGTYSAGKVGLAMNFNGTNNYLTGDYGIAPSNSITREITLAAWIKPTTISGQQTIYSKYDLESDGISFHFSTNGGKLYFQVNQSDAIRRSSITANTVLSAGVYQHVAATFNTATQAMQIFVNGVSVPLSLVDTGTVSSIRGYYTSLRVGALAADDSNGNVNTQYFGGQIDELQMYNRVLSISEIQSVYNAVGVSLCLNSEVRGNITTSTGRVLTDVLISTADGLKTNRSYFGSYELFLEQGLNHTITPKFSTHSFSPASYSFNPLTSDQIGKNFIATLINDNFASAVPLTGESGEVSGNNQDATRESGEPLHAGVVSGKSVWYRWRAPRNGTFTFSLGGSAFDTLLGVYRGTNVSNLSLVAANDNIPNIAGFSQVTFQATAATDYYIAVDGRAGGTGSGNFKMLYRPADYLPGVTVSGTVKDISEDVLVLVQGATIKAESLDGAIIASTVAAADGTYSIVIPQGITSFYLTAYDYKYIYGFTSFSNVTQNQTHNFFKPRGCFCNNIFEGGIYGVSNSSNLTLKASGAGSVIDCILSPSGNVGEVDFLCPGLLPNGTYVLTPSQPSSTFTPGSLTFTNVNSNILGIAFVNNSSGFTISGTVTRGGIPLNGVLIDVGKVTTETNVNGNYSIQLPAGGNYTVSASLPGFSFVTTSPTASFTNLQSNQTVNFSGTSSCSYTLPQISSTVPAAGGYYSFNINTNTGCAWEAKTNSTGFTVASSLSYDSGTVFYFVEANTGAARTGTITVAGQAFTVTQAAAPPASEADVDPSPNGNQLMQSSDVVQMRLFLNCTGTQPDSSTSEFQRADSSPFDPNTGTYGDGKIQSDDIVQTRRYLNHSDAVQTAAGPTSPVAPRCGQQPTLEDRSENESKNEAANEEERGQASERGAAPENHQRQLRVQSTLGSPNNQVTVNILVDAVGDEVEYGFTVNYNQSVLTNPVVLDGNAGAGARACNTTSLPGRIFCSVGNFPTNRTGDPNVGEIAPGDGQILIRVTFTVSSGSATGPTPVTLTDVNASDDTPPLLLAITAMNGAVTISTTTPIQRTQYDFDGDGKADVAVFRSSNGGWFINQSLNGFTGLGFGQTGDRIVPADYDGDGKTDVAVYRNGTWFLQRSQLGFTGIPFGLATDIPQPADFDGDKKAELAVFRPSDGTWYVLNLVTNQFSFFQFGQNGDKAVVGDYDGDGRADYAVYRAGGWFIQRSQLGFIGIQFGEAADRPVPADYDGDGKADVAVFRPSNSTWYLLQSTAGFTGLNFGTAGDIPAAADFDGDGRADIAVFRPSIGTWFIQQSGAGFTGVQFGQNNDTPVSSAFVP